MVVGIETSDILCSVAFWDKGQTLFELNHELPMQHASLVGQMVQQGLDFLSSENVKKKYFIENIKLLSVAIGPGSFTGLRIGLSFAQGLCFGRNIQICGISNHQVLASFRPAWCENLYTIIEARREQVYMAKHKIIENEFTIIDEHSLVEKLDLLSKIPRGSTLIYKNNLEIDPQIINSLSSDNNIVLPSAKFSGSSIASLGWKKLISAGFDDLAELEPLYIRPFAGVQ
jgi:tRNA threonylcarbamoyladenosine biosynthesis protein TsaB